MKTRQNHLIVAYKISVNIKDRKTNEHVQTLIREVDQEHSMDYLYRKALNEISNYFKRYIQGFEIHPGKFSTYTKRYWNVQPTNSKLKASIVIELV